MKSVDSVFTKNIDFPTPGRHNGRWYGLRYTKNCSPNIISTGEFQKFDLLYNNAARPRRPAPTAPVRPVGRAAPALPEADPDPVAELTAEFTAEEMLEATEPAWLVALSRAEAPSLVRLLRMELAAVLNESKEDCAPEAPVAAAEDRLARLLERSDWTEVRLAPTEDSTEFKED